MNERQPSSMDGYGKGFISVPTEDFRFEARTPFESLPSIITYPDERTFRLTFSGSSTHPGFIDGVFTNPEHPDTVFFMSRDYYRNVKPGSILISTADIVPATTYITFPENVFNTLAGLTKAVLVQRTGVDTWTTKPFRILPS